MNALWIILPLFAGTLLTIQAAVNGSLGKKAGSETSTLVSFFVGLIYVAIVTVIWGRGDLARLPHAPAWQWITALCGVAYVFLVVFVVPRIGVVVTTVLVIVGQLCISMLVDHFGLFGNEIIPFGGKRLLGLILMLAAVCILIRSKRCQKPSG